MGKLPQPLSCFNHLSGMVSFGKQYNTTMETFLAVHREISRYSRFYINKLRKRGIVERLMQYPHMSLSLATRVAIISNIA